MKPETTWITLAMLGTALLLGACGARDADNTGGSTDAMPPAASQQEEPAPSPGDATAPEAPPPVQPVEPDFPAPSPETESAGSAK